MANVVIAVGRPFVKEYNAANGNIEPGMFIERTTDGDVQAHATAGGKGRRMFANVDVLLGNGREDAYAADSRVNCLVCAPGQEVYAWLATGNTTTLEDTALSSNGDGSLKVAGASDEVVAYAMEAKANTSGSKVEIRVEVA